MKTKKNIFKIKCIVAVAPSVPACQRTTVPAGQRGSGAPWHRDKFKKWNYLKCEMENIQALICFDFIFIMAMVLALILSIIIITTTILLQLNDIIEYLIDVCYETTHTNVTIGLILIMIVFKIKNMITLIWIHVLILTKMRIKSKLKMKMNHNNWKLNCNTMDQFQLTQVMLRVSQCCKVQLFSMSNIYLFIYLIL